MLMGIFRRAARLLPESGIFVAGVHRAIIDAAASLWQA
jgi:hypothetical protein